MLSEYFGTTINPVITLRAGIFKPLAGALATAYFTSEDSYRCYNKLYVITRI